LNVSTVIAFCIYEVV